MSTQDARRGEYKRELYHSVSITGRIVNRKESPITGSNSERYIAFSIINWPPLQLSQ